MRVSSVTQGSEWDRKAIPSEKGERHMVNERISIVSYERNMKITKFEIA